MGIIVIAAGTSLPDTFVSVRAAKEGDGVTSLTDVLGSDAFDLLVAIPLAGSATIDFLAAIPTMGFLGVATLVFDVFTRTDPEAYTSSGYLVFLAWMTLKSVGLIETVRGI